MTFQSQSGKAGDVTVSHTAGSDDDNYVVFFKGADHIRFNNLTFNANGSSYARIFVFDGETEDIKLTSNVLNGNNTTSSSNNYDLIHSDNDYWTSRVIKYNTLNEGSYAIRIEGISNTVPSLNTHIMGNTFHGAGYTGIELRNIDNSTVKENEIDARIYGIYLHDCDNAVRVLKNRVVSASSYGIYAVSVDGGSKRVLIANNFLTSTSSSTVYGLYSSGNANLDIYNNSIHLPQSSNGYAFYQAGGGNNLNIVNNIFANTGGGYAYLISNTSAIATLDYNDLFTTGAVLARWANNDQADLAALQSASGKEANSVSINPGFVSDTDLHATTVGLDNLGQPLASVTMDIDGQMRDNSTPDIGADEFDGSNNAPQLVGPLADTEFEENSGMHLLTARLDTVFSDMDADDTLTYETKSDNSRIYASLVGDSLYVSAANNYHGEGNVMVYGIDRWGLSAVDTIYVTVKEVTTLEDIATRSLPTEFSLQQNYPNPFNPTTTIRYALPRTANVTIEVFNGLGQKVAALTEGTKEAGYHTIQFDGRSLSSGMYFYRMQAGDFHQIKRMILVK